MRSTRLASIWIKVCMLWNSTTIDLCLSLFPWAKFRRRKAAVKMHTLLDLHGNIPTFIRVTSGDVHDVNILDEIMPEAGSFYVMDRGYIDFQRLFVFTLSSAFFVVNRLCTISSVVVHIYRGFVTHPDGSGQKLAANNVMVALVFLVA